MLNIHPLNGNVFSPPSSILPSSFSPSPLPSPPLPSALPSPPLPPLFPSLILSLSSLSSLSSHRTDVVEKEVPAYMQDLMEKKQGELIGLNHRHIFIFIWHKASLKVHIF